LENAKNIALSAKASVSSQYGNNYLASFINDGKFDIHSNNGRWVSAGNDVPPYAELRFEKPIEINAFWIVSGRVDNGLAHPNKDFHLQYLDKKENWIEINGTRTTNNNEFGFGKKFPAVTSKAFRFVVTKSSENLARIWEWELYRLQ
jgi:hypothetical protein